MVSYAVWRLLRSHGAPVAVNQTEMASYFSRPKTGAKRGPSIRSISRWWPQFTGHMNGLGYRLVRAHDYGVDKKGDRRRDRLQSKLSWLCFSVRWERSGNFPLYMTSQRAKRGANKKMRPRWLRDEKRKLLTTDAPTERAMHYANSDPVPFLLSDESRKVPDKQSATGAHGPLGVHPERSEGTEPLENASWRLPERVLKSLWGISRRHLKGESPPLVSRASELWRAGFPASRLLSAVRFAASWAGDSHSGHRGRIAAAVLAGRLMRPNAPVHAPPSNEDYHAWVKANTRIWRAAAVLRARSYREDEYAKFAASEGMSVEQLRRRIRESFENAGLDDVKATSPNTLKTTS